MSPSPPKNRWLVLVVAALGAQRDGGLAAALRLRPRLAQRVARRLWPAFLADLGRTDQALCWQLLLRAGVATLRPDGQLGIGSPDEAAWRQLVAWRPYLALACHQGLLNVPSLAGLYRGSAGETPAQLLPVLWGLSTSSFYRCLSQARQGLAQALAGTGWWDALAHEVHRHEGLAGSAQIQAWHARHAANPVPPAQALWHTVNARDLPGVLLLLERHRVELANHAATAKLLHTLPTPADSALKVRLSLAQAGLALVRSDTRQEQQHLDAALRVASARNDSALLGSVFTALGKFHEVRDPRRALAYYEDALRLLREALPHGDEEVRAECLATLTKLAYQKLLGNDAAARGLLDEAEALRSRLPPNRSEQALLEQCWGEYWRRADDIGRAIEHKLRALHLYERLGELQQVLKTWVNLGLLYAHQSDFARSVQALEHVLAAARRHRLQPDMLASVHLNLGATRYRQGRLDAAIDHYRQALDFALGARLTSLAGRAHFNLAEAHYKRFLATDSPEDEHLGDSHAAAALAAWPDDADPSAAAAARSLRGEMLGADRAFAHDRMWPAEVSAHPSETSVIAEHRAQLSKAAATVEQCAASRLAIAQAYADIAARERDALLAFLVRHGLRARFGDVNATLKARFQRDPSSENRLAAIWREQLGTLLPDAALQAVTTELLRQGQLSKSVYAKLCAVGLSTASRHLAQITAAGLLLRDGRGPGTRYRLPPVAA